ncbi:MAG: hypothetical protein FWD52_05900 [Candidatus Bathyarchaeota archaeon]|nr:hypothetical protein [Candidatus Termiticorpusculum sp.]
MLAREGDFIQHKSNVIFDVKGLIHPKDRIVAFPRYIPNPKGSRHDNNGVSYGKVYSLEERFKFLQKHLPNLLTFDKVFNETLCEVPTNEIINHFQPQKKLSQLLHTNNNNTDTDDNKGSTYSSSGGSGGVGGFLEEKALRFALDLHDVAGVSFDALGVSGSILAGLTTATSDIDLLVYGVDNCHKVYATLHHMFKKGHPRVKAYTSQELEALYDFRSQDTHMSFKDFQRVETRKAFQGMYQNTDFFIRFVKDWPDLTEQYGDIYYHNIGYTKITATINNNSETLFTPCTYQLKNVTNTENPNLPPPYPIREISSFRGRFCEQAQQGEIITAQGKVELVINKKNNEKYYRLILGSKPQDYMILKPSNAEFSKLDHNNENNMLG